MSAFGPLRTDYAAPFSVDHDDADCVDYVGIWDGNTIIAIACAADGETDIQDTSRRIVAAVNGTSTLSTPALEAGVVDKLVEAAVAVLHDWHSETGFVESVRLTTGRPWPWYHGEKSVADLRAALALARGEQA